MENVHDVHIVRLYLALFHAVAFNTNKRSPSVSSNHSISWVSFIYISHVSSDSRVTTWCVSACWRMTSGGFAGRLELWVEGFLRHVKFHSLRLRSCHDTITERPLQYVTVDIWACLELGY